MTVDKTLKPCVYCGEPVSWNVHHIGGFPDGGRAHLDCYYRHKDAALAVIHALLSGEPLPRDEKQECEG